MSGQVICKNCGNENQPGDQFCGSCGSFMEWSGEVVSDKRIAPMSAQVATAKEQAEPQPLAEEPSEAGSTSRDETLRRAAALVAAPAGVPRPVSDVSADGLKPPEARQPGQERIRRGPQHGPTSELNTGDLVCGQCGTGNPPTRKFCRSCGTVLTEAMTVKVGWWARLKRKLRRSPKSFNAGDRRARTDSGRGATGRRGKGARNAFFRVNTTLLRIGAALGVLALLGFGVEPIRAKLHLPNVRQPAMDRARELFTPVYDQVRGTVASGTGAVGHGADQLIDGGNNTWWSAPDGEGAGDRGTVTISFAKPTDLAKMLITSGVPSGQQGATFVSHPRPSELRVTVNGDTQSARTLSLKDKETPQTLKLVAKQVQRLEVKVLQVYPASPISRAGVAITEVEFFNKRRYGDDYETIAIPNVSASSSSDQLKFLVDGDINTAWTSTAVDNGVGQEVTVRFGEPVDLDRVRISTGYGADTTKIGTRPSQVQLVLTCTGGCDPTVQVRLPDKPGLHTFKLRAKGVTQVQLQIRTVTGTGGGAALSELQFQHKRPKNN